MLLTRKRRVKPRAAPGTIASEGAPARETKITVMSYSAEELEEKKTESVDECFDYVGKREVKYLDKIDFILISRLAVLLQRGNMKIIVSRYLYG